MSDRELVIRRKLSKLPPKRWLYLGAAALLCAGALAYANVPNTFKSGDPLSSTKVNANFADLDGRSWPGTGTARYFTGGNVGIGTATPAALLHLGGVGGEAMRIQAAAVGAASIAYISFFDGAGTRIGYVGDGSDGDNNTFLESDAGAVQIVTMAGRVLTVTPGGNVGIGNASPSYALDVNGTIRGSNLSPSDARLKSDVRTLEGALDGVARLRGVRFKWKKDGAPSIGLIAQELEAVYPELVSTAADGIKSVDYGKLSVVLIEATKSLRAENQAIRAENAELRSRLDRIEARLDRRATR